MHRLAPPTVVALIAACATAPVALGYRGVAITVQNSTSSTLVACGWNGQDPTVRGQGSTACGDGPFDIAPRSSRRFTGDYHSKYDSWDTVVQVRVRQSAAQRFAEALPVVCGAGRNPAVGRPDFRVSARWAFDPIYARRMGTIYAQPAAAFRTCSRPWWTSAMSEPDSRDFAREGYATGTVRRNDDSSDYKEFVITITGTDAGA